MITQRSFAVLSALFLIGAVALATFGARAMTLEAALGLLDRGLVDGMQGVVGRLFGPWTWAKLVMPLLIRPAWLVPASLGLICLGLTVTLTYRNREGRSRRRG